jgi:type I restriction enzyme R subunit
MDEETLALYDLLRKPDLSKPEISRIKEVAAGLLATLKERLKTISDWREREASRDAVRVAINDYLWDERTGLPVDRYDEGDVNARAEDVFRHVFRAYPTVPSPVYSQI